MEPMINNRDNRKEKRIISEPTPVDRKGRFTVPQEKHAISNYGGMKNKGRIRLYSTAQYGLTIFWKEVR